MSNFFKRHHHLLSILVPIVIGLIFITISSLNLVSSIWFDEAYSAYLVRGNFVDIWQLTAVDVHPPLFYFCLKIWSILFGTTDFALRFMSVFFGLIAIIFAFQLIKRWFSLPAATIATFIMSISPMFIRYAQEMRMYTLLLAIVFSATFFLTLALDTKKRIYWITYGILVSLGMWTHYFSALVWLAHLVFILHYFGGLRKFFAAKSPLLAYLLSVLLFLPWLPAFIKQTASVQGGFWIPEVSLATPLSLLSEALLFQEKPAEVKSWLVALIVALLSLFIFFILKAKKQLNSKQTLHHQLIFAMVLLPPIFLIILSLPPLRPIFVNRYVSYSTISLWLLFGLIITAIYSMKLAHPLLRHGLVATVLLTAALGIINVQTRQPSGFVKDAILPIYQLGQDHQPILAGDDWIYYDAVFYSSERHPVHFFESWTDYRWSSLEPIRRYRHNLITDLPAFLSQHHSFWYLVNTPKDGTEPKLPSEIASHFYIKNKVVNPHHTSLELERISNN